MFILDQVPMELDDTWLDAVLSSAVDNGTIDDDDALLLQCVAI